MSAELFDDKVPRFETEHDPEGGKKLSCKIEREAMRREWFELTGVEHLVHLVLMQRLSAKPNQSTILFLVKD